MHFVIFSIVWLVIDFFTVECTLITAEYILNEEKDFVSISNGIMCSTKNKIGVIQIFILQIRANKYSTFTSNTNSLASFEINGALLNINKSR